METQLLNQTERRQVSRLIGRAITDLSNALAITTKAQERVINGSVNVTIQYTLRNAIKAIAEANNRMAYEATGKDGV
jgi:hypothetical protein